MIDMRTMSLYESGESSGAISLSSLFNGGISGIIETGSVSIEDLAYYIVRGGWPDSLGVPAEYASSFASDYVNLARLEAGASLYAVSRACSFREQGLPFHR